MPGHKYAQEEGGGKVPTSKQAKIKVAVRNT